MNSTARWASRRRAGRTSTRPRAESAVIGDSLCVDLDEIHPDSLIATHDAVFPSTYIKGREIVDQLCSDKQVFVYNHNGQVLGYTRVLLETPTAGYIEYVGVRKDSRRRGIGRELLRKALSYLIDEKGKQTVTLCVMDESTNAKALYASAGFSHLHTGINFRQDRKE